MLTAKQLLLWTKLHRPVILSNARGVAVKFDDITEGSDEHGDYKEVMATCIGNTSPRTTIIRFYGVKIWVSCSCEYFLYHCEVAVKRKGSSDIIYSNGKFPKITNKRGVSHICKHCVAALMHGAENAKIKKKLKPSERLNKKKEERSKKGSPSSRLKNKIR